MHLTKLRLVGFKSFVEASDFDIQPGLTGVVGPERLRQVEPRRGAALGDGRELVQKHARVRHGRRHLFRAPASARPATSRRSASRSTMRAAPRPQPSTMPTSSRSPAASSASRARPTASTAARCAPATCRSCSPTPRPARAHRRWSGRARSPRSSRPSRRRVAAFSKMPPVSPACTRAATRRSCG